jgi:hypothetical protein
MQVKMLTAVIRIWFMSYINYNKLAKILIIIILFLLLPLGAYGIRETLRFTSISYSKTVGMTPWTGDLLVARPLPNTNTE